MGVVVLKVVQLVDVNCVEELWDGVLVVVCCVVLKVIFVSQLVVECMCLGVLVGCGQLIIIWVKYSFGVVVLEGLYINVSFLICFVNSVQLVCELVLFCFDEDQVWCLVGYSLCVLVF